MANARLAYAAYEEVFGSGGRWTALAEAGAWVQRPLWASTGVKNPDYSDTLYVTELVAPDTVNTMPEKTLDAVADHGGSAATPSPAPRPSRKRCSTSSTAVGIDLATCSATSRRTACEKFEKSWQELLEATQAQLDAAEMSPTP